LNQIEEKLAFIDEFLARCEDWMHGEEGDDVSECRRHIREIMAFAQVPGKDHSHETNVKKL
jgi:hypothetical protein